jgi:energy-converting hydrogenase Eha subunit A
MIMLLLVIRSIGWFFLCINGIVVAFWLGLRIVTSGRYERLDNKHGSIQTTFTVGVGSNSISRTLYRTSAFNCIC